MDSASVGRTLGAGTSTLVGGSSSSAASVCVGEAADGVVSALRVEADRLRRKHQRKGAEYRVRIAPGLGLRLLGDTDEANESMSSALSSTHDSGFGRGASSDGGTGTGGGISGELASYDPRRAAEAEVARLVGELTTLRETASSARSALAAANRKRNALKSELAALAHARGVEAERDAGLMTVSSAKADVARLVAAGDAEDAYRETLEHMLGRALRARIESLDMRRALEDSLAAHTQELSLKRGLLARVAKSRKAELAKLFHMQSEARKTLRNLDRKLEDRREELRVRTERARLLQTAASGGGAEASLDGSHHGPTGFSGGTADGLSPEEERVILDELKLVNARAAEARAARLRLQAEADGLEAEYNSVRIAAGLPPASTSVGSSAAAATATAPSASQTAIGRSAATACGVAASPSPQLLSGALALSQPLAIAAPAVAAAGAFAEPHPDEILARFASLERELNDVEASVTDFCDRLAALGSDVAAQAAAAAPTALVPADEENTDPGAASALALRVARARRALDAARAEHRAATALTLQLEQAVRTLCARLASLPAPPTATSPPVTQSPTRMRRHGSLASGLLDSGGSGGDGDDLTAARRALDARAAAAGAGASAWALQMHRALAGAVATLHSMLAVVSPARAASLASAARRWAEGADSCAVPEAAGCAGAGAGGSAELLLGDAERLEKAIEGLVSRNAWGVRVPYTSQPSLDALDATSLAYGEAGGAAGASADAALGGLEAVQGSAFAEAAQAFDRSLRDSVSAVLRGATAASGDAGDGPPTRRSLASSAPPRSARAGAHTGGASQDSVGGAGASGRSIVGIGFSRRATAVGAATAALKPKPRELSKMFAAAAAMGGREVDETIIAAAGHAAAAGGRSREPEEIVTRDALKRATKTALRQHLRSRHTAAAAAAAAAAANAVAASASAAASAAATSALAQAVVATPAGAGASHAAVSSGLSAPDVSAARG